MTFLQKMSSLHRDYPEMPADYRTDLPPNHRWIQWRADCVRRVEARKNKKSGP